LELDLKFEEIALRILMTLSVNPVGASHGALNQVQKSAKMLKALNFCPHLPIN